MTASSYENRYDPIVEAFEGRRTPGSFASILQLVIYGYIFAKEAQVTSVHNPRTFELEQLIRIRTCVVY
jgi:hypothetical protein